MRRALFFPFPKKPQDSVNRAAFKCYSGYSASVYNYVINHTRIACVYIVNKHASTGFDRCLDQFALLVYDATGSVENVRARMIRSVLANNEGFERLIIRRRTFL